MPGFTLRLTDEQHAALTDAAKRNHRSLQQETIHRLFPEPLPNPDPDAGLLAHFKPDPKPTKEKKK